MALQSAALFEEAQRAIAARDHMLGVVSHDLRNPLSVISLTADLLGEALPVDATVPWAEPLLRRVKQMVKRMNVLIQDLLDLTRLASGRLHLEREPVAAGTLIAAAVELLEPLARDKGIALIARPAAPGPVVADRDRVLQVFSNLVGNALKVTPEGGQVVLGATPAGGEVCFSVADTGRGMSPARLAQLFDADHQRRAASGTGAGLGLSIARAIVEAHGGRIWAESAEGRGATISFTLPVEHQTAGPMAA